MIFDQLKKIKYVNLLLLLLLYDAEKSINPSKNINIMNSWPILISTCLFDIRPMHIFPYLKVMNMIMNCSQEMSHIIPCTVIRKAFS